MPSQPLRPRKNGAFKAIVNRSDSSDARQPNKRQKTSTYQLSALPSGRLAQSRSNNDARVGESTSGPEPEPSTQMNPQQNGNANENVIFIEAAPVTKRDNQRSSDRTRGWLPFRQHFLDEVLRHEGLGDSNESPVCCVCSSTDSPSPGMYRCVDCDYTRRLCQTCLLGEHKVLPLHRVQEWTGEFYKRTNLYSLGAQYHLGHGGAPCPDPGLQKPNFVVCDTNGFHRVHLIYCGCYNHEHGLVHMWRQLMRIGWYPATHHRPSTAFTFHVLDFFSELTHQGKANLYDFHKTLDRITDNSGTVASWTRYRQFSDVVRQWKHLQMLKRSGRGHDPAGVIATKEGQCAVECAACPHPGRNLPNDWEQTPADVGWVYTLFLMLDANFRLKLKDRGFEDVELSHGWAYVVEQTKYVSHIGRYGDQTETNTCSAEHAAIRKANSSQQGYLAAGMGTCLCARHSLVRRNGAADLEKGEKYCSMDYVLLATLIGVTCALLVSYDIACQYHKNFPKRQKEFPPCMRIEESRVPGIRWVIPKKHWAVHKPENHSRFSLNYVRYVGRTYGEGIESSWPHMNPVSSSTKEMAPSGRRETLDDHYGSYNWQKIIGFGSLFARNLKEAFALKAKHEAIFIEYTGTFRSDTITQWKQDVERWNVDHSSKPDPYEELTTSTTMKHISLKLAEEDAIEVAQGLGAQHEVSPSAFIQVGLDLEEQQRALKIRSKTRLSIADQAGLQQKRNTLMHRVTAWRKIQETYMPAVQDLLSDATHSATASEIVYDEEDQPQEKAEEARLYLPSHISDRVRAICPVQLSEKEQRLREAQASDALADIRRLRRIMAGITQFKRLNVSGSGQKANTRIRALYDKFQGKVTLAAARYRAAFAALKVLDPDGGWAAHLRELLDKDITGPGNEDDTPLGEGRREMSWIWRASPGQSDRLSDELSSDEFDHCMQVEWSKTQARALRWKEETILLQEEMRRTLQFFQWKAEWWRSQGPLRGTDSDIESGLRAYANKQAAVYIGLAHRFADQWLPLLKLNGIMPSWAALYTRPETNSTTAQSKRAEADKGFVSSTARRVGLEEREDESGSSEDDDF